MKRDISIEMTSKYISLTSRLIGRIRLADPNQVISYLDLDLDLYTLGKEIRKKLAESKEISEDEFIYYWNRIEELDKVSKLEEERIIQLYNYKNKRTLYKDTLFLSLSIFNNTLTITPHHQDGLGSYTSVRDKDGWAIKFEYPISLLLSPEELGKAVMKAFNHSTSIYK